MMLNASTPTISEEPLAQLCSSVFRFHLGRTTCSTCSRWTKKTDRAHDGGNDVSDAGGNRRAGQVPMKNNHEQPVQHDICNAARHRQKRAEFGLAHGDKAEMV